MDRRTHTLDEQTLTAERAFEWLQRLGDGSAGDQDAFRRWLNRSPQNIGEVLVARSTELVMRQLFRDKRINVEQFLSASASIVEIGDGSSSPLPRRRRGLRLFAVAGLALVALVAALLTTAGEVRGWLQPTQYRTSVGEQRSIELPDGSVIAIDAQSSVRVDFSESTRDVYLNSGQAMFTVAKDANRPFRVHVVIQDEQDRRADKDTIIQALGTKFDVNRRADRIHVAVVEGSVHVRYGARSPKHALEQVRGVTQVMAGHGVSIERTGSITRPTPVKVADISAWQQRRLVFTDSTLEEIAEEFRRYNRTPRIRIADEALRTQRFSGMLDADDPEALLTYLAYDNSIALSRTGDDIVIRLRPTVAPAQTRSD